MLGQNVAHHFDDAGVAQPLEILNLAVRLLRVAAFAQRIIYLLQSPHPTPLVPRLPHLPVRSLPHLFYQLERL